LATTECIAANCIDLRGVAIKHLRSADGVELLAGKEMEPQCLLDELQELSVMRTNSDRHVVMVRHLACMNVMALVVYRSTNCLFSADTLTYDR